MYFEHDQWFENVYFTLRKPDYSVESSFALWFPEVVFVCWPRHNGTIVISLKALYFQYEDNSVYDHFFRSHSRKYIQFIHRRIDTILLISIWFQLRTGDALDLPSLMIEEGLVPDVLKKPPDEPCHVRTSDRNVKTSTISIRLLSLDILRRNKSASVPRWRSEQHAHTGGTHCHMECQQRWFTIYTNSSRYASGPVQYSQLFYEYLSSELISQAWANTMRPNFCPNLTGIM